MSNPPKRDRAAILAVAAILVAIGIVAAAAYVLLTAPPPPPPAPSVDLAPAFFGDPGDALVNLSAVSQEVDLGLFRAELRDVSGGNVIVFAATLRAGVLWSSGAASVRLTDGPTVGKLSAGDGFVLENLTPLRTYTLALVYIPEGATVASRTLPM